MLSSKQKHQTVHRAKVRQSGVILRELWMSAQIYVPVHKADVEVMYLLIKLEGGYHGGREIKVEHGKFS